VSAVLGGLAMADLLVLSDGKPLHLRDVAQPILLVPFAAFAALRLRTTITLSVDPVAAVTDGQNLRASAGDWPDRADALVQRHDIPVGPSPLGTRAIVSDRAFRALTTLAHRTYAPASERSRAQGAGAGQSDND
ncbi:MAG: DUF3726 domain-containing protein, partial [Jannaschia sp.]